MATSYKRDIEPNLIRIAAWVSEGNSLEDIALMLDVDVDKFLEYSETKKELNRIIRRAEASLRALINASMFSLAKNESYIEKTATKKSVTQINTISEKIRRKDPNTIRFLAETFMPEKYDKEYRNKDSKLDDDNVNTVASEIEKNIDIKEK